MLGQRQRYSAQHLAECIFIVDRRRMGWLREVYQSWRQKPAPLTVEYSIVEVDRFHEDITESNTFASMVWQDRVTTTCFVTSSDDEHSLRPSWVTHRRLNAEET